VCVSVVSAFMCVSEFSAVGCLVIKTTIRQRVRTLLGKPSYGKNILVELSAFKNILVEISTFQIISVERNAFKKVCC